MRNINNYSETFIIKAIIMLIIISLKKCTPDVLVFDNEKLKTQYPDLSLLDAFRKADAQVAEALRKRLI